MGHSQVKVGGLWQKVLLHLMFIGAICFRIGEATHPGLASAGFDFPDMPWGELEAESDNGSIAGAPFFFSDDERETDTFANRALHNVNLQG